MPDPTSKKDLEWVLNAIDARAALVILVNQDNELETAAKGIDNEQAMFELAYGVAYRLAESIFGNMPAEQQRQAAIALPTLEEARRLGLRVHRNGRN